MVMEEVLIPNDNKEYILIDNFGRSSSGTDINGDSPSYSLIGATWEDSDVAVVGYVTIQSGGVQFTGRVGGLNQQQVIQIDTGQNRNKKIFIEARYPTANGRSDFYVIKRAENQDSDDSAFDAILITVKNNAGDIDTRCQQREIGSGSEIADTDGVAGFLSINSPADPAVKFGILIEDTGTSIKVTISGKTREFPLPTLLFTPTGYVGIRNQKTSDEIHQLRVY